MKKKIITVNAGPRKGWNTDTLISEARLKRHESIFPQECQKAFELGAALAR